MLLKIVRYKVELFAGQVIFIHRNKNRIIMDSKARMRKHEFKLERKTVFSLDVIVLETNDYVYLLRPRDFRYSLNVYCLASEF